MQHLMMGHWPMWHGESAASGGHIIEDATEKGAVVVASLKLIHVLAGHHGFMHDRGVFFMRVPFAMLELDQGQLEFYPMNIRAFRSYGAGFIFKKNLEVCGELSVTVL